MLIGDIDYFKQYNDTYGHAAGDKVLVKAAKIIKKKVIDGDMVCRRGGEEFKEEESFDECVSKAGVPCILEKRWAETG